MPRISDNIAINNETLDRRVKLTAEDKELVKLLREEEQISYQKLANRFGVSKRLIIFICKPESKIKDLENRAKRGGSKIYYDLFSLLYLFIRFVLPWQFIFYNIIFLF